VLDVLVGNAVVHGAGAVNLRFCAASGGGLAIDVSDEGRGVGRDDLAGLFTRTEVTADGHGIGLSLAATLVRAEGGHLTLLETDAPPTFRVLLPEADEEQ
jgi:signal transduction histidine kinase